MERIVTNFYFYPKGSMGNPLTHGWRTVENRKLYGRCNNIRLRCHDPRDGAFHHYGDRFNSTGGKLPDVHLYKEWHKPNIMCDWVKEHLGWPIVLDNEVNDPEVVGVNIDEGSIKVELDRINNFGGYEPENIAWVSKSKNHLNRRDSHGKTKMPVFNEWKYLRDQVKAGKIEIDPNWDWRGSHSHGTKGFKVFLKEMGDQFEMMEEIFPHQTCKWMIARIDEEEPYSWENCVWVQNFGKRRFDRYELEHQRRIRDYHYNGGDTVPLWCLPLTGESVERALGWGTSGRCESQMWWNS